MAKRQKEKQQESTNEVYAEVVFRSRTGGSLLRDGMNVSASNLFLYEADEETPEALREQMENAGFSVITSGKFGMSIRGPKELYEEFFNTKVAERSIRAFSGGRKEMVSTGFFMAQTPAIPNDIADLAETVYIPRVGRFLAGEGAMPNPGYYHLRPPGDIANLTNAVAAHNRGYLGAGVRVAMVDSGFIANHDYYNGRGYNITVQAAVGQTTQDEIGHGTGIASNLLAIAPGCDFHFYKMYDGTNWAALAAFRMAVNDGMQVITNSWSQWFDPVFDAEIRAAVANGITVIFAAGNMGPPGWPGCMPEVISVGGAYPRQGGGWEASSYASSGINALYPARHCPDLSAIVGQAPQGILIVMPTMMNAEFDNLFGGGTFPTGDETAANDGWLVASGTSSAAPMVAGAAAILLEVSPGLAPAGIRNTLANTCIDVLQGSSSIGEAAGVGVDSATGAGMIDIGAAVNQLAPAIACLRAPQPCLRAPIEICLRAPTYFCTRAPIECYRAPIECYRAPIVECARAPILECGRAPIIECGRAPIVEGCQAGPWMEPIDPRIPVEREGLIPLRVMVAEEEIANWLPTTARSTDAQGERARLIARQAALEAYNAVLAEMGIADEYRNFPDVSGRQKGRFSPQADG